jgi:hypothetical protein
MLKLDVGGSLKKLGVLGVRERVTALDIVNACFIQPSSDGKFIFKRKVYAFPL